MALPLFPVVLSASPFKVFTKRSVRVLDHV
jgi:hypothetical protein